MTRKRIIYMGTPAFAVPTLEMLSGREDIDIALVVTQPDRPAGRGKKLTPPPVKETAMALNLPLLQTATLRDPDVRERITSIAPDLIVVAAFGMILGKWILELPSLGCVNLHASLLPKYRGASPISAAILAGDEETGVTLMRMERGLDTGPMLDNITVPISSDDTTSSLTPRLAIAAAELLDSRLSDLLNDTVEAIPQPEGATETRQLIKEDGRIDWNRSATEIERQVRAMWDWPRAWTELPHGERMQIHAASVDDDDIVSSGEIQITSTGVRIGTGQGSLLLKRVQLPGGKPVEGQAMIQKLQSLEVTHIP
ncbi:MAG: methionyl-tRNA formyltransferase [Thermomicrobiales bacterium]|nr:methionyl-tRNA formyltransferase [Thermomicrobiales bacterium]